ncbi:hypothetical protein Tco_0429258 [Tanacetum coccineum]
MKLKSKKCSIGVEEGPFLGHLITKQGIKANPSKVKVITDLKPLKTLKEIHINGKLPSLSRFILNSADKSLLFFKALKSCTNKKTKQWTMNAKEAFQKMKEFIEVLPMLTTPIKGNVLVMNLAASKKSISAVILAEREKRQVLIYDEVVNFTSV